MKVTEIFRNDGWWSNLYIVLDDKYRVHVRLFNEGKVDIQIDGVESVDEIIVELTNATYIKVDSSLLGNEYSIPNDLEDLTLLLTLSEYPAYNGYTGTYEGLVKKIEDGEIASLYKKDEYAINKYGAKEQFNKYGEDVASFINDAFILAHKVALSMIKGE